MIETVSTLPSDFTGTSYCADVHVSPSGKFLYGSNRGHNSIVVFEIDPRTGKLKLVEHVSTEGNWPRNFTIDPTGDFCSSRINAATTSSLSRSIQRPAGSNPPARRRNPCTGVSEIPLSSQIAPRSLLFDCLSVQGLR